MPQSHRGRGENEQRGIENKIATWTMWVGVFTGLLVFTSVIANLFVGLQWKTAADAQFDAREQLKAFVTPSEISITAGQGASGEGLIYGFSVSFQNHGSTRTSSFIADASIKYFEGNVPTHIDLSKPYLDLPNPRLSTIIGPNSKVQVSPVTVTADEIENAISKKGVIVIWGSGSYSDVFEPNVQKPVRYCHTVTPRKEPTGLIAFQFTAYRNDCNTLAIKKA